MTQESTPTLEPCPFCGGEVLEFMPMPAPWGVICRKCGAETCLADTKAEAIAAWNRRSPPTSQSEALVVEIASILDHPSLYMGGPSWGSKIKAERILPIIKREVAKGKADALQNLAHDADQSEELSQAKADAEMLAEENARLRKYVAPEWFYLAGDMSSDRCRFSVWEVIDEDWAWDNRKEGTAVVQIESATRCPDIWALVHFFTNEEKDARQSDDEYEILEFASEDEANAALASYREKHNG